MPYFEKNISELTEDTGSIEIICFVITIDYDACVILLRMPYLEKNITALTKGTGWIKIIYFIILCMILGSVEILFCKS